jgi:hypothetical protein
MPGSEQDFLDVLARKAAPKRLRIGDDPTTVIEDVPHPEEEGTEGRPTSLATITPKNLLRNQDAHPVVLDMVLIKKYGTDWLEWEPETFDIVLRKDFGETSDLNIVKIQAMKTLHLVDTFWQRWEVFNWLTACLNSVFPDFELLQVPTVAQCMVAVDIANRVRMDVPWSDEVKEFLAVVHRHDGIFVPQAPLDFVKVSTEGLPMNAEEIAKQWPEVRASGKPPSDDTVAGEQLRRMLIAHGYLEESRARLNQQLPVVPHV